MRYVIYHPDSNALSSLKITSKDISLVQADYEWVADNRPMQEKCGLVAAGNSFGIMDGGLDLVMLNYHGQELQKKVQEQIALQYNGELPIGHAVTCEVDTDLFIYAPTMQIPMVIAYTDNVYRATLAAVRAALDAGCGVVYLPLMGAGTGRVPLELVGRQMQAAIEDSQRNISIKEITWEYALKRHERWHYMTGVEEV